MEQAVRRTTIFKFSFHHQHNACSSAGSNVSHELKVPEVPLEFASCFVVFNLQITGQQQDL